MKSRHVLIAILCFLVVIMIGMIVCLTYISLDQTQTTYVTTYVYLGSALSLSFLCILVCMYLIRSDTNNLMAWFILFLMLAGMSTSIGLCKDLTDAWRYPLFSASLLIVLMYLYAVYVVYKVYVLQRSKYNPRFSIYQKDLDKNISKKFDTFEQHQEDLDKNIFKKYDTFEQHQEDLDENIFKKYDTFAQHQSFDRTSTTYTPIRHYADN